MWHLMACLPLQGSHTSSLRELIQAHSLVKVQLNQQHEVAVAAVAQQLAEASGETQGVPLDARPQAGRA